MPWVMLPTTVVVSRPEISNNTDRPAWPVARCRANPPTTALDAPAAAGTRFVFTQHPQSNG
jgi:hypothetical protein